MGKQIMRKYVVALGIKRTVRGIGNCDVVFYLETVEALNMEDAREEALDIFGGIYDIVFIQPYKPPKTYSDYDPEEVKQHILQRPKKQGVQWPENTKRDGELYEREVSKET